MVRVLHVLGLLDRGGAESVIMELYRHIDRNKVQFDFVVHTSRKCAYNDEIEKLGGRIYSLPPITAKSLLYYKRRWKALLVSHPEWQIVHGHVRSTASIYLQVAKELDRITIIHSHSTSSGKGLSAVIKNYLQKGIKADYYFACSKKAGEWLFGEKVHSKNYFTLPNAIETSKYAYDETIRSVVRQELDCEASITLGHVGSFFDVKNHVFLIDVFFEFQKKHDAKLILVGDGILKANIETKVNELGISDRVSFLGIRSDVNRILQAIDIFILPSKYEGLPVCIVEAQTSGVPCVISDMVPDEVIITNNLVTTMSLSQSAEKWAEHIASRLGENRRSRVDEVQSHGYDISSTSKWLQDFYLMMNKQL